MIHIYNNNFIKYNLTDIYYSKNINTHFNNWYLNYDNYLFLIDNSNYIFNNLNRDFNKTKKNCFNFIKKKSIQKIKPKNLYTFTNKNSTEKKNYDFFFTLEGTVVFKERCSKNKTKFFVTYKFGEKLNITFNDSELFKHSKKFDEIKLNDTLNFFFFINKKIFTGNYDLFYNGLNIYNYSTWRQFFIIPNNVHYQNHLLNFTKNDKLFNEMRSNILLLNLLKNNQINNNSLLILTSISIQKQYYFILKKFIQIKLLLLLSFINDNKKTQLIKIFTKSKIKKTWY